MRIAIFVIGILLTQGCTLYATRQMSTEQIDSAVKLLEAQKGQGCLCVSGLASPPGGALKGVVVGSIGGVTTMECAQICIEWGR